MSFFSMMFHFHPFFISRFTISQYQRIEFIIYNSMKFFLISFFLFFYDLRFFFFFRLVIEKERWKLRGGRIMGTKEECDRIERK